VEVARTERQMRVERMKLEFQAVRDKDALAFRQQEAAVKKEIDDATFDSQLKKLEALDRLDRETTRFQAEMAERQRRVDSEMKMLEDDKASQRELARIREVKGLSVEALMATAGPDIARVLAEVEKHRASEETKRTAGAEVEKVRAEAQSQQAQMMERLAAAAEDKAAALLQAMKDAMAVQQQTTQQAFQAMGQMGQGAHPQVTVVPGVGGQPLVVGQTPGMVPHAALDPAARRVVVCAQCRTENDEKARFCSNCGNKL